VLRALAEVEDSLSGLAVLNEAETTQAEAVAAAARALDLANARYTGGLTSSLEVVSAQQTLLNNQRLSVQLQGERLVTTVLLVKALGGGWQR
jgi:outer membrane protein, multidrug efflux system